MNWIELKSEDQLEVIREESKIHPILIFKHSTRCSISATALNRLERTWSSNATGMKMYYLDLISYRAISNQITQKFEVEHESPQVLVLHNGKAVLVQSHLGINADEIRKILPTN